MSIASEITRLQGVKSDILTAIADKGVTVPTGSMLDDCPDLIASISGGGGGSVLPGNLKRLSHIELKTIDSNVNGFNFSSINDLNTYEKVFFKFDVKSTNTTGVILYMLEIKKSDFNSHCISLYRGNGWEHVEIIKKPGYPNNYNINDGFLDVEFLTENSVKINGTNYTGLVSTSFIGGYIDKLLAHENNLSILDGSKFYELEIFSNNDELKYRIIPVLNTDDNKPYLYEEKTENISYNKNWVAGIIID